MGEVEVVGWGEGVHVEGVFLACGSGHALHRVGFGELFMYAFICMQMCMQMG